MKISPYIGILFIFCWFYQDSALAASCNPNIWESTPTTEFDLSANDGTVVHSTTGLMWSRCSVGQTWNNDLKKCEGIATILTWTHALAVTNHNYLAGYTDWRLPNIKELASITEKKCWFPAINETVFPNTPSFKFWSGTNFSNFQNSSWGVDFDLGLIRNFGKSSQVYVRLVRAGRQFDSFITQKTNTLIPYFLNISTRGYIGKDSLNMHAGIVVTGNGSVPILIKARGPSLPQPLVGLQDPSISFFDAVTGTLLHQNDNWQDDPSADLVSATGLAPIDPREPAFVMNLPAGSYTAVVSGVNGATGIAIPSATKVFLSSDRRNVSEQGADFLNISTRGYIGRDSLNMHAGIVVTGNGSVPILIKARGPSLPQPLVGLQDPSISFFDAATGTLLHQNDNWQDDPSADLVSATGLAPIDPREPAFIMNLPAGSYTAVVSGVNGATGITIPSANKVKVVVVP